MFHTDLAHKLGELIGFNFTIKPVKDNQHGRQLPNGSWDGMIRELIDHVSKIAEFHLINFSPTIA